jgi:predicted metal-dependent peptidase
MWTPCETDFNLERHLIVFLQEAAFFAEISRHLRKIPTYDIDTCAVTYNSKTDELCLYWNPAFFGGGTYKDRRGNEMTWPGLSNWEIRGVLTHEFYHLVFGHLSVRRRQPDDLWNIATDCAINSIIVKNAGTRQEDDRADARPLPREGFIPGIRPYISPEMRAKMTPDELARHEVFCDIIEKFPKEQASEWYFTKLQEEAGKPDKPGRPNPFGSPGDGQGQGDGEGDQPGNGRGRGGMKSLDDHSGWDEIPEELREYIEGKVKSIVEKAVAEADKQSNGWGSVPSEIASEIRKSISSFVNWRSVLRQFVGSLARGERTTSIKRINRRYPYIHPGVKRGYTAKLLIAIDQSGSVHDEMLESFFSELGTLTKRVTVDILPFDCFADPKDIFEWRKGTSPKLKRVRSGGTDFNAPTSVANDTKFRGRWDGMLIMTDGECGAPNGSRVKRGWVLGKGQKLYFESSELQVFLDDSKPMTGAWR